MSALLVTATPCLQTIALAALMGLIVVAAPRGVSAQDPNPVTPGSSAQPSGPAADVNDAAEPEPESSRGFWATFAHTTPLGVSTRPPGEAGFWGRLSDGIGRIWGDGQSTLIVSGYAWHTPWKHKSERQKAFNDAAWGAGFGRTFGENDRRQRLLYVLANNDSHDRMQYMFGYAWQARWHPYGMLRLGAGYTLFLIGRQEYNYIPGPLILPAVTAGTDTVDVFSTYVPYGEVFLFLGRVTF